MGSHQSERGTIQDVSHQSRYNRGGHNRGGHIRGKYYGEKYIRGGTLEEVTSEGGTMGSHQRELQHEQPSNFR